MKTVPDTVSPHVVASNASARLKQALEEVRKTQKGKELYDLLDDRKEPYVIRDMKANDPAGCRVVTACYGPRQREIVVDTTRPGPEIQGIPSSVERRLGHEMSHGVHEGLRDPNLREYNAQRDDTAIAEQLGKGELPRR